jgi:indole-3-glycerol phosphate synthase
MARSGPPGEELMPLLEEILRQKAVESSTLRGVQRSRPASFGRRDAMDALRRPPGAPLRLIAEIKFRSPSAGALSQKLDAGARAQAYERGGAAMVSVLTDERWFGGSFDDLAKAREAIELPLLCKDFLVDAAQVDRAWASGADAMLVIVRCLRDAPHLAAMLESVRRRGLEPFVEVVDEEELALALDAGAGLIGVNARDLDTLEMDAQRARRVLGRIPPSVVAVHFSGLKSAGDAAEIAASRADAALIGEALMRLDDPESLLRELVRATSTQR